ncbi:hypothetical protein [Brevundimonas sp.]|uniref:hypothetical protein n=1 Tax=Brevundimonas sp. TaxID=1871086 RepID=UPI00257FFAA7|nr:hypothetical protein [Brevundimonas sp.]MEC7797674.1 hypothetical protein [Pseudomonadota bacterium]MED5537946.1 hypothetical protein [Pseudomonadota bacterium]
MRTPLAALSVALLTLSAAAPAHADTRYFSYNATDRITQALTKGITLQVRRGLFGAVAIERLFSTTARGSADLSRGGPDAARRLLPEGAKGADLYEVQQVGDGRGLARALCPGADQVWLAASRIRAPRPLTLNAVGRWADGTHRHCVTLTYEWRGEWQTAPASPFADAPGA